MKKYVITIGRQFGCGAHEIGTRLAQRLDIDYYDKELIQRAAQDSGFDKNLFAFYDERPTQSFLFNLSADGYSAIGNTAAPLEEQVFQYQFDTIHRVAGEGSCIIVGRCAEYILRQEENLLSVFLHADDDYRIQRVTKQYGISEKDAAKEIKSVDKKRARFHNFYCDSKWGDASAYDLCIDVSKFGIDETVELLVHCVNEKFGK